MKKVEELKDLGCSVRGRFYDLTWSRQRRTEPNTADLIHFWALVDEIMAG